MTKAMTPTSPITSSAQQVAEENLAAELRELRDCLAEQIAEFQRIAPAFAALAAEPADSYVDLDQCAALVNRSKRTLERYIGRKVNPLPVPDVQGVGGKKSEWRYSRIKGWLETESGKILPARPPHAVR